MDWERAMKRYENYKDTNSMTGFYISKREMFGRKMFILVTPKENSSHLFHVARSVSCVYCVKGCVSCQGVCVCFVSRDVCSVKGCVACWGRWEIMSGFMPRFFMSRCVCHVMGCFCVMSRCVCYAKVYLFVCVTSKFLCV